MSLAGTIRQDISTTEATGWLNGRRGAKAMAKRGRTAGFRMSDEHRVKIQNSNILNALVEHVEGRREMSATQVTAGLGLLKKILPDLASVEIGSDPDKPMVLKVLTGVPRPE